MKMIAALSILSMIIGNAVAIAQRDLKRMLAYSGIAHVGYMLIAVISLRDESVAAIAVYTITYALMNIGAFGVVSMLAKNQNDPQTLDDIAGLGFRRPFFGLALTVCMFSLSGLAADGRIHREVLHFQDCDRLRPHHDRVDRHPHQHRLRVLLPSRGVLPLHARAGRRLCDRGGGRNLRHRRSGHCHDRHLRHRSLSHASVHDGRRCGARSSALTMSENRLSGDRDVISELTTGRLSVYLRCLTYLESIHQKTVSSHELAQRFHLNSAQIRKDLACFGEFGTRGVGYNVSQLKEHLVRELGIDRTRNVLIVGAGNLGMALADYRGFNDNGFQIAGLIDVDPPRSGGLA